MTRTPPPRSALAAALAGVLVGGLLVLAAGLGVTAGPWAVAVPGGSAVVGAVAGPAAVQGRAPLGAGRVPPAAGLAQGEARPTAPPGLAGPPTGRRRGLPVVLAVVALLGAASLLVRVLLAEPVRR